MTDAQRIERLAAALRLMLAEFGGTEWVREEDRNAIVEARAALAEVQP